MRTRRVWTLAVAIGLAATRGTAQGPGVDIQEVSLDSLLRVNVNTAAKYAQGLGEAPASVTVVTSEDIRRFGRRTLREVLMGVRGFYLTDDRNYTYLGVRGFSRPTDYNDRVLLLLNGHTLNEDIYGGAYLGTELALDPEILDRVEIVRGPGSALYGTGAMFAVINMITRAGDAGAGFHATGEAATGGGRQGSVRFGRGIGSRGALSLSGSWGDAKGRDLYFKAYDAPGTNGGVAVRLDWDRYYGFQSRASFGNLSAQGFWASRKKGIPTGAFGVVFNHPNTATLDRRQFLELEYGREVKPGKRLQARGFLDFYQYKGWYPYEVQSFDGANGKSGGGEFQFRWDTTPGNRLTIGSEVHHNFQADLRVWDVNATSFSGDFPFTTVSLYLQNEFQATPNLSLTAGVRGDHYSTVGSAAVPRGAVVYHPARSATVKFLYGEAFRAPNVNEVNYEDAKAGTKANRGLHPERIRTAELVYEQRLGGDVLGSFSVYRYQMKNLIDQQVDPADGMGQFQNVSRVDARGLEVEVQSRRRSGLWWSLSYSVQETGDKGQVLTNSPAHLLKAAFSVPVLRYGYASTSVQFESERSTVYLTRTPAFLLASLHLTTRWSPGGFRGGLSIRNLFNTAYRLPGGIEHRQDSIPQDGRSLGARAEFQC